jgi:8-oxo-dGTP pyrophosphatase MutT (NUDIX family)
LDQQPTIPSIFAHTGDHLMPADGIRLFLAFREELMQPWMTRSKDLILDHSKYLRVENHTVELPDGQIISEWPWIITPDFINVVAVTQQKEFLCFRQTKYGISGTSLAPVGGYIEPGEVPLAAAKRELLEETGYKAPDWTELGRYIVDANRGAGTAHLFLAHGAQRVAEPSADDLEEQQLLHLTRTEIEAALAANAFKALSWATAISLALQLIRE